jgi:Mn2+/Fe2+ NRAMP family transporter
MVGGAAIVLHLLFGKIPLSVWVLVVALSASALIFKGYYKPVEKISLVMITAFTATTIFALIVLQYTEFRFSWKDVAEGLKLKLPSVYVAFAFGAFGITGVGSDEIIAYNYWCMEKGYAACSGLKDHSPEWKRRARGWIQVMYLDASVAMLIYTLVTAAFYLLGAAVLHGMSAMPEGNGVIETISLIYTQSLGYGARIIYLVGAFFVLFSSVFASLAAWTRLFSDIGGQLGWIDFSDFKQRKKAVGLLAWILPALWATMYFTIQLPVLMILSGGIVGSFLLFIVVFAAVQFRKNRMHYLPSGFFYNSAFALSVLSIVAVGVYGLIQILFNL